MLNDFDLEGKNKVQKAAYYLQNYGMSYTAKKALRKFGVPIRPESEYMTWCRRNAMSKQEIKEKRELPISSKYSFTAVLELGEEERANDWSKQIVSKIDTVSLKNVADAKALAQTAKGDYLVFSGRQAVPHINFLYEVSKQIKKGADFIYTDEDNLCDGKRVRPFFKPDASLHLLLNYQYMGKIFVVKKSLFEKVVEETDGEIKLSGDDWYDIALQCYRFAAKICHIPKVLFSNEVPEDVKTLIVRKREKRQADAIEHYLKTEGIEATVTPSEVCGFFHIEYVLKDEPLISIIIPNKDHIDDLKICIDSLRRKSEYQKYEVIIAENNSEDEKTFAYYEELQKLDDRIHVVKWEGGFNYSAINNYAAKTARGEILLFLNNDTEFIDGKALRALAECTVQKGVAAAGAMLYYGDDTIQHGGVTIGLGGFAANSLWSLTDRDETYYPFSNCIRETTAATAACLMVRREVFDEVGGFSEDFVVALNDVDLCMKIRDKGYKILFTPYAKLYHYESKSRGFEDTMEKQERFRREIELFQSKWEKEIKEGDPFYNPNLTLHRADYSMDI